MSIDDLDITADELFTIGVEMGCSDIHIKAGSPPKIRKHGEMIPIPGFPVLTGEQSRNIVEDTMNPKTLGAFVQIENLNGFDYSYDIPDVGRFRMNAYHSRGNINAVARLVQEHPKTLDELGTPEILKKLAMMKTGIIVVAGATGSGKSTTLAGMIDYINENKSVNIISTEQPIEVLHEDKKSSVSQREVGTDVSDFASALKASLRQDPDVILIGEVRDIETMRTVLVAADTGHLVITTLHTTDAAETINRIIALYPVNERSEARRALASSMRGIVGQRILPKIGGGQTVTNEVLLGTPEVADIILDETKSARDLKNIIINNNDKGMRTFEQDLERLVRNGTITIETAKENSVDPEYFDKIKINNNQNTSHKQQPMKPRVVLPPSNQKSLHLPKKPPLPFPKR